MSCSLRGTQEGQTAIAKRNNFSGGLRTRRRLKEPRLGHAYCNAHFSAFYLIKCFPGSSSRQSETLEAYTERVEVNSGGLADQQRRRRWSKSITPTPDTRTNSRNT